MSETKSTTYDDETLYQLVFKVNEVFYEKVYKDQWFKKIFFMITEELITAQQTDFIVGALGGPRRYCGRSPKDAHPHIFITEEMWELREKYLKEAFVETKFPEDLKEKWLRIDESFKNAIIKNSPDECERKVKTEPIINVPSPFKKAA